jgi:hypothetical protein
MSMDSEGFGEVTGSPRLLTDPWPALLGGLAANAVACGWYQLHGSPALILIIPGLLATGAGVAIRPRSAPVLGLAAVSGFLACWGLAPLWVFEWHVLGREMELMPSDSGQLLVGYGPEHVRMFRVLQPWDSAQLLVGVLSIVAAFAALIVLLPRAVQRAMVSVMIVLHFIGILSAVSSVPPTPALMNWAWTYFYRPYLQFMYLNNAYHFYSPEPGPGIMDWFYIRYQDGTAEWYKIPDRSQNPLLQEYQRRLSLAESTNQLLSPAPVAPEILQRRTLAAQADGIPLYPTMELPRQHREPTPYSKEMVATYARFIAHLKAGAPGKIVRSVKVYRVVHNLPRPEEIADRVDPTEKHFYYPYYQGEFTPEGKMINPEDPYLYWLIPIVKTYDPAGFRAGRLRPPGPEDEHHLQIVDLLEVHAGLTSRRPSQSLPNFVPGGQAEEPAKKSAAIQPAPASVPR